MKNQFSTPPLTKLWFGYSKVFPLSFLLSYGEFWNEFLAKMFLQKGETSAKPISLQFLIDLLQLD